MVGGATRQHLVPSEAHGERLDRHLASAFPELSRSRIQQLIAEGCVQVGGEPAKGSRRLRGGEEIQLTVPPPAPARPRAEALPLSVLYDDPDLVVVDKAAGMVVHPAAGHAGGTLVNALLHRVTDLSGVGGELRPGLVHRLDKDTSGCMVVAKNEAALAALQAAFKARRVRKIYLALVHGHPPDAGRLETLFGRHPVHRKRFSGRVKEGKPALTLFRVVERFPAAALLEVDLRTGRTHQIRVHLSEAGHPLLGDALYGGARRGPADVRAAQAALGRQALHAWRLALAHPRTGVPLSFEAPIPADLTRALEILRGEGASGR